MLLQLIIAKAAPGSDGARTMAAIAAPPGVVQMSLCASGRWERLFLPFYPIWLRPAIHLAEGLS